MKLKIDFKLILIFIIILYICYKFYYNKEHFESSKILFNKLSNYQKIKVEEKENKNRCLYLDREIQLCTKYEKRYHEYMVHFPAAYIENLSKVLIIGGGDLMILREVMKYNSIDRVDMLELDKLVVNVSKRYFYTDDFDDDDRVNIYFADARKTIEKLPDNFYDLIIIDITEQGHNKNPLISRKFYKLCSKKIKSKGIIIQNGSYLIILNYWRSFFKYLDIFTVDRIFLPVSNYSFMIGSKKINFRKARRYDNLVSNLDEYNENDHMKKFIKI